MRPHLSNRRNHGLTLVEVLVVIVSLAVVIAILLPVLAASKRKSSRIGCVNELKQIRLVYRIWSGDNGDLYPMQVSVTNGGSMEMAASGNAAQTFQVMSNELSTPKILHCPEDTAHSQTDSVATLANANISYFVNVNVTNSTNPQLILSGDSNFEIAGVLVKSGLLELSSNTSVAWTSARHKFTGNLGLNDGSVQSVSQSGLISQLHQTGLATNHLAIP